MTVTIRKDDLNADGSLDDFINVINGQNMIRDSVLVHIFDGHHLHDVFWDLLQDPYPILDWTKGNI